MKDIAELPYRVRQEDIDELGHVNNRVYLRWVEDAARTGSALNGWTWEQYKAIGGAWVARQHWIEYLRPCELGDDITVYTWVEAFDGRRSLRRYAMVKKGKLCCCAATEWVFIDLATRRAVPCYPEVAACFQPVPKDDPRLKELGIARGVRWEPAGLA